MSKPFALLIISMLSFLNLFSQSDSLQKQINEQVWKPFISSFASGDDEIFRSVHSKDVTRAIQDNKQIMGFSEYFKKLPDSVKAKWGNWKKTIELRFVQRIANNEKAFEVGYYKSTSTNPLTGETRTGYGKFHVLLRKENGRWKILMDADAHEKTDEKIFQTGKAME